MSKLIFVLFIFIIIAYYKSLKFHNHTLQHIQDIGHTHLPYVKNYYLNDVFLILPNLYMVYILHINKKLFLLKHYLLLVLILYSLRWFLHNTTVLPVIKSKQKDKNYVKKYCANKINLNGGCNDYIFSGHVTLVLLSLMFIMYAKGEVVPELVIYSVFFSVLVICSHTHYTVDVLLAWIITILMFTSYFLCIDNEKCSNLFNIKLK